MIYTVAVLIFMFIWTLISAAFFIFLYKEKPIEKLKYYDEDYVIKEKLKGNKKNKISLLKLLSNLIPNIKFNRKRNEKLENELMKADLPITPEELLIVKILSSTSFAFLFFAMFKDILIVVIIFIAVWNIPKFIISKRKKDRIKLFNEQLNEGVMIMSNSLKAGYSFLQSTAVVVEETKAPFSKEFRKLLKEMSLGISEEDALRNILERMESEDLRLIVNAILIQKDIGGNLSEILDNISETIRERQKIKNELKTLTAQGKLSGIVVMLIPIFLGIAIYFLNKEYVMLLFNTTLGIVMVTTAFVNQILGLIIIKKIINIDM